MFKRDWFSTRYASTPATSFRVLAVDAAYKVGLSNDFSALVTVGVTPNGYAVLDVTYGRWEYPQLRQIIQDTAAREQVNAVLIEDSASGQSILQELRQSTRLAVLPVKVTASKEARATAIVPTCEAKRVQLPSQAAWLDAFVDQMAGFPTVAHDDIVDATVHALGYLAPFSGHGKVEEKRVTFGGVQDKKPQVPGDSRPKRRPQPASVSNWDMLERTIKDERSGRRTVSWR
jgi:predicted phage terminase large subunit-like protein